MEDVPSCYELLTMSTDPEMERYLRSLGADWFFERRESFQKFLKQRVNVGDQIEG